jgi:hypothetical protein
MLSELLPLLYRRKELELFLEEVELMVNHYTLEKIEQKFKEYRDIKLSDTSDDDYRFFCDAIHILPMDIVDRIHMEVLFTVLGTQEDKAKIACFLWNDDEDIRKKKAIIVLTPIMFGFGIDIKHHIEVLKRSILHEIAHYILEHKEYKDIENCKQKDLQADELADRWIKKFIDESLS